MEEEEEEEKVVEVEEEKVLSLILLSLPLLAAAVSFQTDSPQLLTTSSLVGAEFGIQNLTALHSQSLCTLLLLTPSLPLSKWCRPV